MLSTYPSGLFSSNSFSGNGQWLKSLLQFMLKTVLKQSSIISGSFSICWMLVKISFSVKISKIFEPSLNNSYFSSAFQRAFWRLVKEFEIFWKVDFKESISFVIECKSCGEKDSIGWIEVSRLSKFNCSGILYGLSYEELSKWLITIFSSEGSCFCSETLN